jgi:nitrate reductase gamma subunit
MSTAGACPQRVVRRAVHRTGLHGHHQERQGPFACQLHTLIGMLPFAIWTFTRLVHAFIAPVGYLFGPYVVCLSRDAAGSRSPRRG